MSTATSGNKILEVHKERWKKVLNITFLNRQT